nr:tyrosine-type recombinase/integrase [Methylobacterium sp. L1A1]
MRVKLVGLHTVVVPLADGTKKTYYYAWRGGPRIKGKLGSPEFIASYNAAVADRKQVGAETFHKVIATYKASSEFNNNISERTRADYTKHIKLIELKFGSLPLAAFTEKNRARTTGWFMKWRDGLAEKSERQADYAWSVLARICSIGRKRGLISTNPAERGGRIYKADRTDRIWTDADEARFLLAARAHMRLPLILALWTGQRQGDLLALTWDAYDGTHIRLKQGKTGKRVIIPCGSVLRIALDAQQRGSRMLLTMEGRPWTADGFRSSWRKACAKAEVTGVTFHDLRGSAVTRLALAGCEVPEIAAITGHSLRDVQEILDTHYLSRDVRLAESAIRKLEAQRGEGADGYANRS